MNAVHLLRQLAGRAEGLGEGGYLLVLDGPGFEELPSSLTLAGGAVAEVRRTPTELHLRHALWRAQGAPLLAVIPEALAGHLPADLLRSSVAQRVHTLSGDEVLGSLLGAKVVGVDDPDLRDLALQHADLVAARLAGRTRPSVIDQAYLESALVEVTADLDPLRRAAPPALLAAWVEAAPRWEGPVRTLARRTLPRLHGDPGRILAWALDEPAARPRALVVHGAVLSAEGEAPPAAWGPLLDLREGADALGVDPTTLRHHLVALARDALAALGPAGRPLLHEADTAARHALAPDQHRTSLLLPLAFRERAHALARRMARGEPVADAEVAALRRHAHAAEDELELLEGMARLSRWLDQPGAPAPSATDAARAYLEDHAFADLAALRVTRSLASAQHHHDEARALLARVAARRDALNEAFAGHLARGYPRALHDGGVVPLHRLTQRVLQPLWRSEPAAPVFLVVLDGCSVPVFLDLLDQLTRGARPVGLEVGPDLRVRQHVGLAPLPTITSHARGALFLGELPRDPYAAEGVFRDQAERVTDPARFKQNPHLGDRTRRLFLKRDLADGGRALQACLQGDTQVVAAVFNAVDDRIGSHDTGQAWRLQVEDVHGLVPALRVALDAGRRVLLTADHGHTPFRDVRLRVAEGSTPRFLDLASGPLPEGFVEVDCGDLAGTPGAYGFAWRSGVYRGQPQVGFHGGCSLEEMVVPVAWLTLDGAWADPPAWWSGAPSAPRPAAAPPAVAPPPAVTPPPVSPPPSAAPSPAPSALPPADPARVPAALRAALDEDRVAVLALLLHHGSLRSGDLARALGRPPHRIDGYLAKLNRALAPHGARLVGEPLPDHERLWRYDGPREEAP